MSAPLISIIFPYWNRRAALPEALRCIQQQRYQNWELVAVDDGSTDGGRDYIEANCSSDQLQSLSLKKNGGAASARNHGAKAARGDYLAFFDSDDIWLPDKLHKQVTSLSLIAVSESSVLYTKIEYVRRGRTMRPGDGNWRSGELYPDFLRGWQPAITPSVMLRRDLFLEAGGFNQSMLVGEDNDLWMRLAKTCHFYCVPDFLVQVRTHCDNRLSSDPDVFLKGLSGLHATWHSERVSMLGESETHRYERRCLGESMAYIAIEEALRGRRIRAAGLLMRCARTGAVSPRSLFAGVAAVVLGPRYDSTLSRFRKSGNVSPLCGIEPTGTGAIL